LWRGREEDGLRGGSSKKKVEGKKEKKKSVLLQKHRHKLKEHRRKAPERGLTAGWKPRVNAGKSALL